MCFFVCFCFQLIKVFENSFALVERSITLGETIFFHVILRVHNIAYPLWAINFYHEEQGCMSRLLSRAQCVSRK